MKRLVFTLVACLIMIAGFGSHQSSILDIRTSNNSAVILILDNQNLGQTNFHSVSAVRPGRRHVKLIERSGFNSCSPYGNTRVLYNGFLHVPARSHMQTEFCPVNGLRILAVRPLFNQGGGSCGPNNGGNFGGNSGGYYDPMLDQSDPQFDNHFDNGNGYYDDGFSGTSNFAGMRPQAFNNLKYQLRNTPFDNDKLRIAMQAIRGNGVSAFQVRELMEMMSFESNRLKLAKQAYQFTIDRQNYYTVNSAFQFSNSVRRLNEYIATVG